MIDFLILYKKFRFDTGVSVSTHHLKSFLNDNKKSYSYLSYAYKDDDDLYNYIIRHNSRVIILEAPTFQRQTLLKIIETGREVNLVIHSTISFLQVEEEAFSNVQFYLKLEKHDNFSISNPCQYEVNGFNSYSNVPVIYLPNTFNGAEIKEKEMDIIAHRLKCRKEASYIKIGLFCAYRPFKNMATQITACTMLNRKTPVELHLFEAASPNPIYRNMKELVENSKLKVVYHKQDSNENMHLVLKDIDIGLQVSYSETFSYIICEHMSHATPTVSSRNFQRL